MAVPDSRRGTDESQATAPVPGKKKASFAIRTASTVVLLAIFLGVMWGGHIPCTLVLFIFQAMMVRELFQLARNSDEDMTMPLFRTQQWYFFVVASFYLYGRFIRNNLQLSAVSGIGGKAVMWMLRRHLMISYGMYIFGFVLFVLTLKQGQYMYQFKQFAWTHMIVLFTAVPTSLYVPLVFEGLMWFLMPTAFIIINDIMAYLAGITVGRTPLIALSPNKTWEGFWGGAMGTIAASVFIAWAFAQFDWLRCPRRELSWGPLHCERTELFVPTVYKLEDMMDILPDFLVEELKAAFLLLPTTFKDVVGALQWTCMPAQMHAMALAVFASIVGPFGGFFASGFKRAFKVKDFGDSIPGHGGITDRFDCQMMMATFAFLYFQHYIRPDEQDAKIMSSMMDWSVELQIRVFKHLSDMLVAEGVLSYDLLSEALDKVQLLQPT